MMTYEQFHEAWQGIPDKFFKCCRNNIYDGYTSNACAIAELIEQCQHFEGIPDVCTLCTRFIRNNNLSDGYECFQEYSEIINNYNNGTNKVRLLAYAVFARKRLRNIDTREWYDFIQEWNKNDTERNSILVG